jgi:hypothetical protein
MTTESTNATNAAGPLGSASSEGLGAAAPERAAFERYFATSRKSKGAGRSQNFARLQDGTYADDHTQRHWWTWQNALNSCNALLNEPCMAMKAAGVTALYKASGDELEATGDEIAAAYRAMVDVHKIGSAWTKTMPGNGHVCNLNTPWPAPE